MNRVRLFLIGCPLLVITMARAGNDSTQHTFHINYSAEVNYYGIYHYPSINLNIGKHSFGAGPLLMAVDMYEFGRDTESNYYPEEVNLKGFNMNYQYDISGGERKFSPFIEANINLQNVTIPKYSAHAFGQDTVFVKAERKAIEVLAGIGYRFRISPK